LKVLTVATIAVFMVLAIPALAAAQDKMPAEKAGTIGEPSGQIAFLREQNVWVMNWDGTDQRLVTEVTNAVGRLSWSADDKMIAFSRNGTVTAASPTLGEGGSHQVFDMFLAFPDSAANGNTKWWWRLTDNFGSRHPEFSTDGSRILFLKDLNAYQAFPLGPNYQPCTMDPDGGNTKVLRKDHANPGEEFLRFPSMSPAGDLAAVYFAEMKPVGLVTVKAPNYTVSMKEMEKVAYANFNMLGPSWSPDGKWIACYSNDIKQQGLYIYSADLTEKYLVTGAPVGTYLSTIPAGWSPDGKWLTYATQDGSCWIIKITGEGARRISGPGLDRSPAWSKTTKSTK